MKENQKKLNDKNKEYELIIKQKEEELINKKEMQLKKGIKNVTFTIIGNSCYINAVLHCLIQTKKLTKYFLNGKDKNSNKEIDIGNKNSFYQAYLELIKTIYEEKVKKIFNLENFLVKLENINPLFKKGESGDCKDFLIFILNQLHKELKKANIIKTRNIKNAYNQYDKKIVFDYFLCDFENQLSIISDLFFGWIENTNECCNCKTFFNSRGLDNPICYNYGIFAYLIFPLEQIEKTKNNKMKKNNIGIYDCFNFYQNNKFFTGDNKNYCNCCKKLCDSIYNSRIYISPNILIIILERNKNNINQIKLEFYENIDISQYILQKEKPQIIYNLYAVITYIVINNKAFFIASCKSSIDEKWYRYKDDKIIPIEDFLKEIIDFGTPYILFYQKV